MADTFQLAPKGTSGSRFTAAIGGMEDVDIKH